jgi:monoamine oxidase
MTIYPSYETNVLIASYTWTNDALKTLALLGKESEAMFKNLVCRDLVAIHGLDPDTGMDFLKDQWVDSYGLSWSASPKTIGGYALFGPGQFSDVYLCLKQPAARGRLHFAGEVMSQRHAWIVGALDASWNAVHAIVLESFPDKLDAFNKLWGRNAGAKDSDIFNLLALSQAGFEYHGLPK